LWTFATKTRYVPILIDGTIQNVLELTTYTGGSFRSMTMRDTRGTPLEPTTHRLLNSIAAGVLLVIVGPLMLLVALIIYLESTGPIFVKRAAINREGRLYEELDFRATEYDELRRNWPVDRTRIGSLLLYTRMVSLPQLINVVRGDISLIEMHDNSSPF